jgi:hypothetical protein
MIITLYERGEVVQVIIPDDTDLTRLWEAVEAGLVRVVVE